MRPSAHAPLDLPRLVMRRAGVVAVAVLALALGLGLSRMGDDIEQEVLAAQALARALAGLQALSGLDDGQALARVRSLRADLQTRHLSLQVADAQGRALLPAAPPPPLAAPLQALLDAHRRWQGGAGPAPVSWALQRPAGPPWTVTLQASHEGERQEALFNLLGMLALLALAAAGLLLAMRWNLRRAFAPLQALLQAIAGIERQDTAAVRALPPMPVRELDRMAQALRHLARALEQADDERRVLAQRVITLQEDERARLARELHDEFGQHLTALQVDAAWLARRVQGDAEAAEVVRSQLGHGRHIQQLLRSVLARLRPLQGLGGEGDAAAPVPLADLVTLLQALADGWSAAPPPSPRVTLQLQAVADGVTPLVAAPLALAIYRITQEALTNAARHGRADHVAVSLQLQPAGGGHALAWQVQDDGVGIDDPAAALRRGSGLAGIKERVWALGAELMIEPAAPGAGRPGLCLRARFEPAQPGTEGRS